MSAMLALMALSSSAQAAGGKTFVVNSTGDGANVSFGVCDDGTGHCTLRGAMIAAGSIIGNDKITFNLPAGSVITLSSPLPDIAEGVSILGPGADKLTVQRNAASGTPGFRIFVVTASGSVMVSISGLTIRGGVGGIANVNTAQLEATDCFIKDNISSPDGYGGGISNHGLLITTRCTISANTALLGGGIANSGELRVINSTITGNSAPHGSQSDKQGIGGGIYNDGTLYVTNCTISGNFAEYGGGVSSSGARAQATVKSSIIAGNQRPSGPSDFLGTSVVASAGFNLVGMGSGDFNHPTDQTGTEAAPLNPGLDPDGLKNNGGTVPTIGLVFGSPAIDKGTSNALIGGTLITDERGDGFARTFDDPNIPNAADGDGTDVGAFEVQTGPTRLANIATRLPVGTGDNALIAGFIVTGTQPKKVIVLGIGPSLSVSGRLENPTLELYGPAGRIDSNDNWVDSPNRQAIIDSGVAPSSGFESAIVATLPPTDAGYTAVLRGVSGGTGIGVVQAYDLSLGADSELANVSTRGFVQTGDNVLFAGIIVVGQLPQKVIVRAIGPSLSIAGKMANPILELHDQNGGLIEVNDNWKDSANKQAIIDSTVPPPSDLESAIVALLPASANYTAIVRGVNNTTGIAVVEMYALN